MNNKWLIPVDGSEASLQAVKLAIEDARQLPSGAELVLINVQTPLTRDITRFINAETLNEFHEENGTEALAEARQLLDASGLKYISKVLVGESAPSITDYASANACTRIVMGARGLGSVVGLLMGSVTTKVVHLSTVPVLLVK